MHKEWFYKFNMCKCRAFFFFEEENGKSKGAGSFKGLLLYWISQFGHKQVQASDLAASLLSWLAYMYKVFMDQTLFVFLGNYWISQQPLDLKVLPSVPARICHFVMKCLIISSEERLYFLCSRKVIEFFFFFTSTVVTSVQQYFLNKIKMTWKSFDSEFFFNTTITNYLIFFFF